MKRLIILSTLSVRTFDGATPVSLRNLHNAAFPLTHER